MTFPKQKPIVLRRFPEFRKGAADYADRRNMKKLMFSIEIIRRKNPNTEELEAICGALARSQSGTGKM